MASRKNDPAGATQLEGVLFDLDGVITDTAVAHMAAWKRLFDVYLRTRDGEAELFSAEDYRRHVDGKPRYDGVESFLASRGIELPFGDPDDDPEKETICGLGNRKNRHFREWLSENSIEVFPGTRALLAELEAVRTRAAVFSSSRNARDVLESAGVLDRFEVRVDGQDMASAELPGKPDPAIMLRAAVLLGVAPERAAIIEDAISGVEAGVAAGNIVIKRLAGSMDAVMAMGLQLLIGAFPLALLSLLTEDLVALSWSFEFVILLTVLAILGKSLPFWLWFDSLENVALNRANAFTFLVPILGLGIGAAPFGERLALVQVAGAALVLGGIVLVQHGSIAIER